MSRGIKVSQKHGVNPSMELCAWCGEVKGIALLGKLPKDEEAPKQAVYNLEPCDKCQEQMNLGITIAESDDGKIPTGRWLVVEEQTIKDWLNDEKLIESILKSRMTFVDREVMDSILGGAE